MVTKASIRQAMREERKKLTASEKLALDQTICRNLCSVVASCNVNSYIAVYLASSNEIDLTPFIEWAFSKSIKLVAPRWNGQSYDLALLDSLSQDSLRIGPMGILEPFNNTLIQPCDIACWIVPGLAFTKQGHRIGYGGGWYDRLMSSASADARKIAVAYPFQIFDTLPVEPHDIIVDTVCN